MLANQHQGSPRLMQSDDMQVQLDEFAMKCLKAVDCNTAVRVLRYVQGQNRGALNNPSAYVVALLKKAECDALPPVSHAAFNLVWCKSLYQ